MGRKTNTSAGYLSRVERGSSVPSVGTLARLAQIFGCSLSSLFSEGNDHDRYFFQKSQRPSVVSKDGRTSIEFLTDVLDGNPLMEIAIVTFESGSGFSEKHTHPGEATIFVLEGKVEVELDEEKYALSPEDSISFETKVPHSLGNSGASRARILVATSPPNPRLPEK